MFTHTARGVGLLMAALFATASVFILFTPAIAGATNDGAEAPTSTIEVTMQKKFSGDARGFEAEQFSFHIEGDHGVDTDVPHDGTIDLQIGNYTVTELGPNGFDLVDWTIQWSGAKGICENFTADEGVIVVTEDDLSLGFARCTADNQYKPQDDGTEGGDDDEDENDAEDATLTVIKEVIGTSTDFERFSFKVNGGTTTTFAADGSNELTVATGTYDVVEVGDLEAYEVTYSESCSGELAAGTQATCTITNEFIGGDDNGDGGDGNDGDDDGDNDGPVCDADAENLLQNGSFEEPIVEESAGWNIFALSGNPALGWLVSFVDDFTGAPEEASLELQRGVNGWSAADGEQYAELDSDWQGPDGTDGEEASVTISQSVGTVPGEKYTLKWQFSPRPDTDASQNALAVHIDGDERASQQNSGIGLSDTAWEDGSITFDADGPTTTIDFLDAGTPNSKGTFLDNVSLCGPIESGDGDDGDNSGDGDDGDDGKDGDDGEVINTGDGSGKKIELTEVNSGGGSSDPTGVGGDLPEPEVLGEQVSAVPAVAPNAGGGGTSGGGAMHALIALLSLGFGAGAYFSPRFF